MWDVKACLSCLSTESKLEKITDIFQRLYIGLTGIKLSDIDGYPMYFCVECHSQIRKALAFKRKCRRAYYVLKEIVNVKKQVTLRDITNVNRKRVNLESLITYNKTGNVDLFSIDRIEPDVDISIATLDKHDPEEAKCDLVKERLIITGNAWHVDIRPRGLEGPFSGREYKDIEPTIENVGLNNETVPPEVHQSVDVFNINAIDQESEDDFPKPDPEVNVKVKKRALNDKIVSAFKPHTMTLQQITEASTALSNANIKRLTLDEQRAIFMLAQKRSPFLTASFKCAMCLTVYSTMDDLVKHVDEHNTFITSKFMCDVCMTKFMDEHDLLVHAASKHLYEYTCKLCNRAAFNILEKFIQHSKFNHKNLIPVKVNEKHVTGKIKNFYEIYPVDRNTMYSKLTHADCRYKCMNCDMKFLSQDYLNSHEKKHSPLNKPFKCDICGVFTTSSEVMMRHMDLWHLYVYKCKSCGELLFNRQEAKHHKLNKHEPDKYYKCDICDKSYRSMIALRQHRASVHYNQVFCHHCIVCGDSFCSLMKLFKHQLCVHKYISVDFHSMDEERFLCNVCDVRFLSMKSYQLHALKHKHEDANTFENACATCRLIFDTADEYREHISTSCRILNRYPRKCAYCDLVMLNYKMYRLHHKRTHKGIPLWRLRNTQLCELCGEASFDIVDHMKKHGEKEVILECRHCSPPVRLRDVWKYCVHMLNIHTPRPFTCALCLEAYATRRECKDHILKVHAPVKPFKCVTCDQGFSHLEYLKEHCKQFLHSNAEMPKRMTTTKKLYVYPHMKLNVSMFDSKVLESVRMYICDYGKTKREPIRDIHDYIVFDKQEELPVKSKRRKIYKKKVNKILADVEFDMSLSEHKLEIVEDVIDQSYDFNLAQDYEVPDRRVNEMKVKTEIENNVECARQMELDIYGQKLQTNAHDIIQYENYRNVGIDEEDLLPPVRKKRRKREKVENIVEIANDLELALNEEKLNVIEQDGKPYVSLSGTLYQVVYEDEFTQF